MVVWGDEAMGTIKELRQARGWSPADLASALGVSVATVYNWETDKHEPRASQLRDIARAFGVSMDSIRIPGETEERSRPRCSREKRTSIEYR